VSPLASNKPLSRSRIAAWTEARVLYNGKRLARRTGRALSAGMRDHARLVPLPRSARLRAIMALNPYLYSNAYRYTSAEAGAILKGYTREEVKAAFADDAFYRNLYLNLWEYEQGETVLESYPCDVSLPIADLCNARCTFCTSWLEGRRMLKLAELDAFEEVIRRAAIVGLAGHGEPLAHPQLPEILDRLEAWLDPRAEGYVITNGVYLARYRDRLLAARIKSFGISLNAATAATHDTVMGLGDGTFEEVIETIRGLAVLRERARRRDIALIISMVLTADNVAEAADFVRLGAALGVDKIQLKTLAGAGGAVPGLNYHLLPPTRHPDYARHKAEAIAAIAASRVTVQADPASWDTPVFPEEVARRFAADPPPTISRRAALQDAAVRAHYDAQDKLGAPSRGELIENVEDADGTNPYGRAPRFACRAPYHHLYVNDFSYNMSPCCYMGRVPGHKPVIYDGTGDFFTAWNSPAMVALRARLRDGPLFDMCTKCPGAW
jgi:pyruvate-formate lyase-activating enzyme